MILRTIRTLILFLLRLPEEWRDIGIRFSVRLFVLPFVNICDTFSVDPTVQVRKSETL